MGNANVSELPLPVYGERVRVRGMETVADAERAREIEA